jgi:hypothetical protein
MTMTMTMMMMMMMMVMILLLFSSRRRELKRRIEAAARGGARGHFEGDQGSAGPGHRAKVHREAHQAATR